MANWLHVYAQPHWHEPARIVGTPDALMALRRAIDKAIHAGSATEKGFFVCDGEGYEIAISMVSREALNAEPLPYTDEIANPPGRSCPT